MPPILTPIPLPLFSRLYPHERRNMRSIWPYERLQGKYVFKNTLTRKSCKWDHRNRLTSVTQQEWDSAEQDWTTTQIVEYAYDYNNVWIRKTVGDSKTIFIPENYQTTVQIDNGTVSHHYLWTPNTQDKLLADMTTDGVLWSLTDHLGTIRDIIGDTSTHLTYDAFGNLISGTNPLLFGYTGKAFDTDTHLQNNINRWYDAAIGRWLSVDPIGFEGNDTNLYRYVYNEPLNLRDYSGLLTAIEALKQFEECKKNGKEISIKINHPDASNAMNVTLIFSPRLANVGDISMDYTQLAYSSAIEAILRAASNIQNNDKRLKCCMEQTLKYHTITENAVWEMHARISALALYIQTSIKFYIVPTLKTENPFLRLVEPEIDGFVYFPNDPNQPMFIMMAYHASKENIVHEMCHYYLDLRTDYIYMPEYSKKHNITKLLDTPDVITYIIACLAKEG